MPQKAHLNGSKSDPKNVSFSWFSNFDLCGGTLGSQDKPALVALKVQVRFPLPKNRCMLDRRGPS